MKTIRKARSTIIFFVLTVGFLSLVRTIFLLWNSHLHDFSIFYDYSSQLLQGLNPYETTSIFSPPVALLLFSFVSIFPLAIAQKIWLVMSVILFCISIYMIGKIFKLSPAKLIIIFSLSTISFPLKFTLGMGQTNMLLLFFIVCFIYFLNVKKTYLSAMFLSLAIILKLIPLVFTFELIFLKKWKTLLILSGILLILLLIPVILTKDFVNIYHLKSILIPLISRPATAVYYNQSVTGFFAKIGFPLMLRWIVRLILFSLTVFVAYKNSNKPLYALVLLFTGFLLINTFTWQHQLILLVPVFAYFLSKRMSLRKSAALIVAYLLLMVNIKNPSFFSSSLIGNLMLSHGFFGILIIWTLLMLEAIKVSKKGSLAAKFNLK